MRYHPWRHASDLELTIELVPNLRARATYSAGLVQIRSGLTQRERRAALAHEIVHYERGDDGVACSRWHLQKLERQVHLTAARRLITIEDLADAVISEPDYHCMAQKLWVDDYTFRLRLAYVSDDERAQIQHLCPPEWRIA